MDFWLDVGDQTDIESRYRLEGESDRYRVKIQRGDQTDVESGYRLEGVSDVQYKHRPNI